MRLIEIDNGRIGHYLSDDTSKEAIDGFVAKIGGRTWREITPNEAAEIIAARTNEKPVQQPLQANSDADMIDALGALKRDHDALKETVRQIIANTHLTDVHKF